MQITDQIAAGIMALPWAGQGVNDETAAQRHGDVQNVVTAALAAYEASKETGR